MLLGGICMHFLYILIIPELVDGLGIRFVLACVSENRRWLQGTGWQHRRKKIVESGSNCWHLSCILRPLCTSTCLQCNQTSYSTVNTPIHLILIKLLMCSGIYDWSLAKNIVHFIFNTAAVKLHICFYLRCWYP